MARAKATLQGRPLADDVRDPKLAERMRKLEARYRFLDDGDLEDETAGQGGTRSVRLGTGPSQTPGADG